MGKSKSRAGNCQLLLNLLTEGLRGVRINTREEAEELRKVIEEEFGIEYCIICNRSHSPVYYGLRSPFWPEERRDDQAKEG